jgi:hypothetical protein
MVVEQATWTAHYRGPVRAAATQKLMKMKRKEVPETNPAETFRFS